MTQRDLALSEAAEIRREIAIAWWIRAALVLGVVVGVAWP